MSLCDSSAAHDPAGRYFTNQTSKVRVGGSTLLMSCFFLSFFSPCFSFFMRRWVRARGERAKGERPLRRVALTRKRRRCGPVRRLLLPLFSGEDVVGTEGWEPIIIINVIYGTLCCVFCSWCFCVYMGFPSSTLLIILWRRIFSGRCVADVFISFYLSVK